MEINKLTSIDDRNNKLPERQVKDAGTQAADARVSQPAGARAEDEPVQLSPAARMMASAAADPSHDVDEAAVASIRQAIEDGTYHVDPKRLADEFMRLEAELNL